LKLEILEVREKSNEVQDLSARAPGISEGKELKGRREMSEAPLNPRHETGHLEIIYSKFPEVRECGKAVEGAPAEPPGSDSYLTPIRPPTNPEAFDKRKQAKPV